MENRRSSVTPSFAKHPENWDAEEVVQYLSSREKLIPFFRRDPTLARAFIDNAITGHVLLNDMFSKDDLKSELGIVQFGVRVTLWEIIQSLRKHCGRQVSPKLEDDDLFSRELAPSPAPQTQVYTYGSLRDAPRGVLTPRILSNRSSAFPTPVSLEPIRPPTVPLGDACHMPTPSSTSRDSPVESDMDMGRTHRPLRLNSPGNEVPPAILEADAALAGLNMAEIGDDLAMHDAPLFQYEEPAEAAVEPADVSDHREIANDVPEVEGFENILVLPPRPVSDSDETSQMVEAPSSVEMPDGVVMPNDVEEPGHDLPPISEERPIIRQPLRRRKPRLTAAKAQPYLNNKSITAREMMLVFEPKPHTDNFVIRGKKASPGTVRGMNGILKHFLLKKSTQTVDINGVSHTAYRHHTVRHLKRQTRNPISYWPNTDSGEVFIGEDLKQHICNFPELDVEKELYRPKKDRATLLNLSSPLDKLYIDPYQQLDHNHLDELADKYIREFGENPDYVLVHYSDGEDSPGSGNETQREACKDVLERKGGSRKLKGRELTPEEITRLFNEYKDHVIAKWKEKKLPKLQNTKYSVWVKAEKSELGLKGFLVARKLEAKHQEEILEKQLAEYKSQSYTVREFSRLVKPSKVSIEEREHCLWKISVLEGPRPPRPPKKARKSVPKSAGSEAQGGCDADEEDLGDNSEAEASEEIDDLDDFIVPDNVHDPGHEDHQRQNEAVIAQLRNRFAGDGHEVGDIEMADASEPEPKPPIENIPPPPPESNKKKRGARSAVKETSKRTRRESASPEWFSNNRKKSPEIKRESTPVPVIDLTGDDSPPSSNAPNLERALAAPQRTPVQEPRRSSLAPSRGGDGAPGSSRAFTFLPSQTDEKPEAWQQTLQQVSRYGFSMAPCPAIFKNSVEPEKVFTRLVVFASDHEKDHQKRVRELGLSDKERHIYRVVARAYKQWTCPEFPAKNLEKWQIKKLGGQLHYKRFIQALLPWLDKLVKEEQSSRRLNSLEGFSDFRSNGANSEASNIEQRNALDILLSSPNTPGRGKGGQTGRRQIIRKEIPENAATRQRRAVQRKELLLRDRRAHEAGETGEHVNIGRYVRLHDPIHFPADEEKPLYPFQKEGIQFLWKIVVAAELRGGALLAHTMGMGKTRQVITLLGLIAETAESPNPKLSCQVPDELKNMRALIIAPAGLLENWYEEIGRWGSKSLAPIRKVLADDTPFEKAENVTKWAAEGTVLLIGYETFLKFTTDERHIADGTEAMLMDTPNIVVADEAHRIKNPKAKITIQFRKFKTLSRIAMTGSPLSNNLLEYYNIMKWADDAYAGPEDHFNNTFMLPIRDGLYADSSIEDIRRSNKLQKALIKIWEPKMHRVNVRMIEDVQDMLPPKTEFVITIPLTSLQSEIYTSFVEKAQGCLTVKESNGFLDAIRQLLLINSHPSLFLETLKERRQLLWAQSSKVSANARESETPNLPVQDRDDSPQDEAEGSGISAAQKEIAEQSLGKVSGPMLQTIETILSGYTRDITDLSHSYRMVALMQIIELCVKAEEKLLVFTQSLKTLDYIQRCLEKKKIRHARLDGKSHPKQRQDDIKSFNNNDTFVCIISIKAGGVGLNIQSASRVVIFDSQFSPQEEEQAVGRAYRLGQKQHVYVYRFRAAGTFEDVIYNNSLLKTSLSRRLVDKKPMERLATKMKKEQWLQPHRVVEPSLEYEKRDEKVLDKLARQEWMYRVETQDMYEMYEEEEMTEDQKREVDEFVKEEERKRAGSVGSSSGGSPRSGDGVSDSGRNLQQSSADQDVEMLDSPPLPPAPPNSQVAGTSGAVGRNPAFESEVESSLHSLALSNRSPAGRSAHQQKKPKRKLNRVMPSARTVARLNGHARDHRHSSSTIGNRQVSRPGSGPT
ncbi:hypothetical protein TWF696_005567 [Orbilia brochopaga]|uniref:SNF2 family helicase/ATPase n=1 Tax=Orbilia brochopaga TaxID=3140254 RepID=A0AAV9V4C9_9PEZI